MLHHTGQCHAAAGKSSDLHPTGRLVDEMLEEDCAQYGAPRADLV